MSALINHLTEAEREKIDDLRRKMLNTRSMRELNFLEQRIHFLIDNAIRRLKSG